MQQFGLHRPPATAGRQRASRSAPRVLAVAGFVVAAFLASGCSMQDAICGSDEYPVKAVGGTTGQACVPNGKQPPKGYVRFPEGKVPEHVGDKWDTYWDHVVLDKHGNVVDKK